ncbi:MAG: comEC [Anaerolineales bacterium]|nr:comEC [Anaerolineales bacterium]
MSILLVLGLGWMAGIWAAAQVNQPWWAWLILAGLGGGGLFLRRTDARLRRPLLLVIALGLGGMRYQLARPPLGDESFLATYNDVGEVALEGVVWDEPDVRDTRTNLRVHVEALLLPDAPAPITVRGVVLVYAPRFSDSRLKATGAGEFRYGDRLRVFGVLETPPVFDDFSYQDYLARQGVYSQVRQARVTFLAERQGGLLWQALFDFKARALNVLTQMFPEPHASLLQGILLGIESGIPKDLKDAFSATGTSHIVAISGFNIAIIAGVFAATANRLFGPQRGAVVAILGIAAYTVLVGAGASVVRAAIMGSLALVAQRIGRRTLGLNTLSAAVIVMTLINPLTLWDVGFQLSAAATLGLVLYAEPFEAAFRNFAARFTTPENAARLTAYAGEFFLLTLAAQLTTLPLIAYYFKRLSLVSLIANLLILPAQPAVMVMGGLALLAGLIWLPLGKVVAWAAWPFTAYTIAFVELFAKVPGASIGLGEVAPGFVVGCYALLFGLTWLLSRPPDQRPAWPLALRSAEWGRFAAKWLPTSGLAALAVGTVVVWSWYFSLPERDGRMRITVLDVGQGDAVLIQTPSGTNVLIDGGPSGGALSRALARQLPLFTPRIDLLVIAAPRDENIGGLPDLFSRYAVSRAVVTSVPGKSATYQTLMEMLKDKKIETVSAADLPAFDLGDGIVLRVVREGARGSALRLEWGRASLLMPIGLDASDEVALLARGEIGPSTALLVADHGSDDATQDEWVAAINPQVAFISVGAGNPDGDPAPEVLRRLAGRTVLRTDEHGNLTLLTDGRQVWVESER